MQFLYRDIEGLYSYSVRIRHSLVTVIVAISSILDNYLNVSCQICELSGLFIVLCLLLMIYIEYN
jgi:hypothetical protein